MERNNVSPICKIRQAERYIRTSLIPVSFALLLILTIRTDLVNAVFLSTAKIQLIKEAHFYNRPTTPFDEFIQDRKAEYNCDFSRRKPPGQQESWASLLESEQGIQFLRISGISKLYSGCYQEAADIFHEVEKASQPDPVTRLFTGLAEGLVGATSGAVETWSDSPDMRIFTDMMGVRASNSSDHHQAAAWFDLSSSIDQGVGSPIAYEAACTSYQKAQKLDAALSACRLSVETAAKADQKRAALFRLGVLHKKRGEYDKALETFQAALSLAGGPTDNIHYQMGNVYDQLEQYADAIREYHAAALINPRDLWTSLALGVDYARSGDLNQAEYFLKRVIDQGAVPSEFEAVDQAYQHLTRAYLSQKDYSSARDLSLQALERQGLPKAHIYRYLLGNAYAGLGDLENARKEYEQAVLLMPEYGEAHLALAEILIEQNRKPQAIEHLNLVLGSRASAPIREQAQNHLIKLQATRP